MSQGGMYGGYEAGVLVANPQRRKARMKDEQLKDCEKEVTRLRARILELETELGISGQGAPPMDVDNEYATDTDNYEGPEDDTEIEDGEPEIDVIVRQE